MPTKTRDNVRRDLRLAKDRLNKLDEYFVRSGALYEHQHPHIYERFCALIAANTLFKEEIQALHDVI